MMQRPNGGGVLGGPSTEPSNASCASTTLQTAKGCGILERDPRNKAEAHVNTCERSRNAANAAAASSRTAAQVTTEPGKHASEVEPCSQPPLGEASSKDELAAARAKSQTTLKSSPLVHPTSPADAQGPRPVAVPMAKAVAAAKSTPSRDVASNSVASAQVNPDPPSPSCLDPGELCGSVFFQLAQQMNSEYAGNRCYSTSRARSSNWSYRSTMADNLDSARCTVTPADTNAATTAGAA
ncbi:hypothetical protein cyc_00985, partial [Cyclospora cayetanensis]